MDLDHVEAGLVGAASRKWCVVLGHGAAAEYFSEWTLGTRIRRVLRRIFISRNPDDQVSLAPGVKQQMPTRHRDAELDIAPLSIQMPLSGMRPSEVTPVISMMTTDGEARPDAQYR